MTKRTTRYFTQLVTKHERWRAKCMNLIASENALSPTVRAFLSSDLAQRYGDYVGRDLDDRYYQGNRYVAQIEKDVSDVARQVFSASEVELRAISGNLAGQAVLMSVCNPGDAVVELSSEHCGHGLAARASGQKPIKLDVISLPFDPVSYNVDTDATREMIAKRRPRVVILGSSCFLFPHPVREISQFLLDYPDTVLLYDASHVFGLVACGEFQDPLREGAHIVSGSTHKTLPGPQGGLLLSNDSALMDKVSNCVSPGFVSNHHLTRIPALGAALVELQADRGYGRRVIVNAQALGRRLWERGVSMVAADQGFTKSHTVLMQVDEYGEGKAVAQILETANIITSAIPLPCTLGREGVRLGTSEVTRHGASPGNMSDAADIIADVLQKRIAPSRARNKVAEWTSGLMAKSPLVV